MRNLSSQNKPVPLDRVILLDKPVSMTSFGAVARLRRCLSQQLGRKVKVGHAGTLDPFASGLLLLLTGQACKKAPTLLKQDKVYQVEMVLGWTTRTLDPESKLQFWGRYQPSFKQLSAVLGKFVGKIQQVPPDFSALKIAGQRAYNLARQGRSLNLTARPVEIYKLQIESYNYPVLKFKVKVSSGTYIRSLVRDIGLALGCGAYCLNLRRLQIGEYKISAANLLSDFGILD